ncbi:MAG: PD-(D/E)XK nuclease domain-containing protein, partial [Bacilli bacterium]|nr:PD-(D/E)XK nuclease domain-containing protein [Bacilli bacterium]
EVNVGRGRCDILVTPKALHGVGMVLEIKQSNAKKEPSRTNLEKIAQSALSQIKEKDYGEELSSRRCDKKIYYGLSFYQKNVAIAVDVEE